MNRTQLILIATLAGAGTVFALLFFEYISFEKMDGLHAIHLAAGTFSLVAAWVGLACLMLVQFRNMNVVNLPERTALIVGGFAWKLVGFLQIAVLIGGDARGDPSTAVWFALLGSAVASLATWFAFDAAIFKKFMTLVGQDDEDTPSDAGASDASTPEAGTSEGPPPLA